MWHEVFDFFFNRKLKLNLCVAGSFLSTLSLEPLIFLTLAKFKREWWRFGNLASSKQFYILSGFYEKHVVSKKFNSRQTIMN